MITAQPPLTVTCADEVLRIRLQECTEGNEDYWSFRNDARRERAHSYFQYPAMMVPQMLGQLITVITKSEENIERIYDPFVGSGTVLGEAMSLGLNFEGQDINPLAILVSRAKCGPFDEEEMESAIARVWLQVDSDQSHEITLDFPNRQKWFHEGVALSLDRIRKAIKNEEHLWVRRFLWIALAETVRLSSNSRTSTYKLHKRDEEDLNRRKNELDSASVFRQVINENFAAFIEQRNLLLEGELLNENSTYKGIIRVHHRDSSLFHPEQLSDFLVTSPPYGDNQTTVPYGQSAYLPLQWIDLEDIEPGLTQDFLPSTHAIDSKSLGGSMKEAINRGQDIQAISPAFADVICQLEAHPDASLAKKVSSFCSDFHRCIKPAIGALKRGAPMVWVVGNRCVGGQTVPLDQILADFLLAEGAHEIVSLRRNIHSKRMPNRNRSASTMRKESIMVWRTAR